MKKDLIYQVCVGKHIPSFYYFCIKSVEDYCKRFEIVHKVQTNPTLKIRPLNSCRSKEAVEKNGYLPIYEKQNVFGMLNNYNRIGVIDADVFIKPDAPNIFGELEDFTFAAVVERDMPIIGAYAKKITMYSRGQYDRLRDVNWKWNKLGAEFCNMGVMMFSSERIAPYIRNQTPEEFIRRSEFERFVNGEGQWRWSTDQTLMNWWIRKEKMNVKHLSWKWNCLYNAVKDESLKDAHFIHFFLAVHLPNSGKEIPELVKRLCK